MALILYIALFLFIALLFTLHIFEDKSHQLNQDLNKQIDDLNQRIESNTCYLNYCKQKRQALHQLNHPDKVVSIFNYKEDAPHAKNNH